VIILAKEKSLLILGPSFRRKTQKEPIPAVERFDGLFFRVAKKYLKTTKNVNVAVMLDDLTLVDESTPLPYKEPEGTKWGGKPIMKNTSNEAIEKNQTYLAAKLRGKRYSEVFVAMGKEYAKALPDLTVFDIKVIFPTSGGPGPKAQALKEWLSSKIA
jgi:hypothetical protein